MIRLIQKRESSLKTFLVFSLALVTTICHTQPVTYEAVRLSETILDSTWVAQEQLISGVIAGVEAQLRQAGISDNVATVFFKELKKASNRETSGKMMAISISQKISSDEAKDINAFLQSTLGKKYLLLINEINNNPSNAATLLLKPVCEAAAKQIVKVAERKELQSLCGN